MQTVLVSLVVTSAACYPVLGLLRRAGRLDVPNIRSSHAVPTPRGGGLALLCGVAAAALLAHVVGPPWSRGAAVAVAGCAVLAVVGLVDDQRGLPPRTRLLAQASVGALVGLVLGDWVAVGLGMVVVPAAVNMVNFMDGINGMCAGHGAVWGVGAIAASSYAGDDVLAVLGALSLGCGLGFLPWNAPRARLFLGDVGSYLIGGFAGVGVLAAVAGTLPGGDASSPWPLLGLACAPYLLFAVDTATAIARRSLAGQPVLEAHRSHVYQLLTNEGGLSHWVVSLGMAVTALLVTSAFSVSTSAGILLAAAAGTLYLLSPRLVVHEVAA